MDYCTYLLAKSIRKHRTTVVKACDWVVQAYDGVLWYVEFKVEPYGHDYDKED